MAHLYKAQEWQGIKNWYVNDLQEMPSLASKWWAPVRLLEITPTEYVKMLKKDFNAIDFHYSKEKNVLVFSFATQAEARKYKNYINKIARQKQFVI